VNGIAGSIFAGLNFSFDNGTLFYNAELADVISPQAGAQAALNYANGSGNAGIQVAGTGGRRSVVMFGFPFETITTAANRAAVIERVFDFFGLAAFGPDNADFNGDGMVDAADLVVWRKYNNTSVETGTRGDANHDGMVNDADYQVWRAQYGTAPPAASAATSSNVVAAAASMPMATPAQVPLAATIESNPSATFDVLPVSFAMTHRKPFTQGRQEFGMPESTLAQWTPVEWQTLLNAVAERKWRNDAADTSGTKFEYSYTSEADAATDDALRKFELDLFQALRQLTH
jgi:hypothetical protein